MVILNPTSVIEAGGYRFLIMDAPQNDNLQQYIAAMAAEGVTHLVRVCEATYDHTRVIAHNIDFTELTYPDGNVPPTKIISTWLDLVQKVTSADGTIAVHCVAGLGRAPVLVAIALIELANFDALDAVEIIRKNRKGSINRNQLEYLHSYKRQNRRRHFFCCCNH